MNFRQIFYIISPVLAFYGCTFLIPALISSVLAEPYTLSFLAAFAITLVMSLMCWIMGEKQDYFRSYMTYLFVVSIWMIVGLVSSLPFIFSGVGSPIDCIFEAFSGITTTGVEMFLIDDWGYSMQWYHHQLQLIGGLGVILIAIGLMAAIGLEGQMIYQIEAKENKWTPRLIQGIQYIFMIYFALYLFCFLGFWLSGMTFFEGLCEAMSTVSTGGFSLHKEGMVYYKSLTGVPYITVLVMILSAVSYRLHYACLNKASLKVYFQDLENKFFLKSVLFFTFLIWVFGDHFQSPMSSLQFISMMTTTGHTFIKIDDLSPLLIHILITVGLIGGCTGSTSGGTRMIRVIIFFKEAQSSMFKMIHPKSVQNIQHGQKMLPDIALAMLRGFWFFWMISGCLLILLLLAFGVNVSTAFYLVASCLSNTGATLDIVLSSLGEMSMYVKSILILAMIIGRVEVMAFFVLFMPSYWRS